MITALKENLWKQFGASIDMLKNAITLWPEAHWHADKRFFYTAYHCLIFLDYYLSIPAKHMSSPFSFTILAEDKIPEEALDDIVPDRIYSKEELLLYNMRHVQHHAAQLNMLLRQRINEAPYWASRAKDDL
ncbi:MAG TPA: hypothetical protein VLD19_15820 [Chitinophagaceae bacterium]|nr:hypothetical protein [Chitinophagaceae bacterium]